MYTPRSCLRITAYHMVDASPVPWIAVPGQRGRLVRRATPGLHELALGGDLTGGRVDEERTATDGSA